MEVIVIHHHYFHNHFGHKIAECALDSNSLYSGVTTLLQKVVNLLLLQEFSLSQDTPLERDEIPSLYVTQKPCWLGLYCLAFLVNCPPHLLTRQELIFLKSLVGYRALYIQTEKAQSSSVKINDVLKVLKS